MLVCDVQEFVVDPILQIRHRIQQFPYEPWIFHGVHSFLLQARCPDLSLRIGPMSIVQVGLSHERPSELIHESRETIRALSLDVMIPSPPTEDDAALRPRLYNSSRTPSRICLCA